MPDPRVFRIWQVDSATGSGSWVCTPVSGGVTMAREFATKTDALDYAQHHDLKAGVIVEIAGVWPFTGHEERNWLVREPVRDSNIKPVWG